MFECETYLPTVYEYQEALGVYGIVLIVLGGLITLILFILFFEQVFYTYNEADKVYRRHIYWISSIYPVMSFMSLLSVFVPRAHQICNAVKITFMAIGVGHFADLTIEMFGGKQKMVEDLSGKELNLQVQPACCCCKFLPSPPITKAHLKHVLYGVWVLKWTQGLYFLVTYYWSIGLETRDGEVAPSAVFLWLNIINFISFLSGVYCLQILCAICREPLANFNYGLKSFSMRLLVLLTKFQTFILDIMAFYGAFPCLEDKNISQLAYKNTIENTIYISEMIFAGIFTYYMYHTKEFRLPNHPQAVVIEPSRRGSESIAEGRCSRCGVDRVDYEQETISYADAIQEERDSHNQPSLRPTIQHPSQIISNTVTSPELPSGGKSMNIENNFASTTSNSLKNSMVSITESVSTLSSTAHLSELSEIEPKQFTQTSIEPFQRDSLSSKNSSTSSNIKTFKINPSFSINETKNTSLTDVIELDDGRQLHELSAHRLKIAAENDVEKPIMIHPSVEFDVGYPQLSQSNPVISPDEHIYINSINADEKVEQDLELVGKTTCECGQNCKPPDDTDYDSDNSENNESTDNDEI